MSWLSHEKAFMIHDRAYYSDVIMPTSSIANFKFFRQALWNHGVGQMTGNDWEEDATITSFSFKKNSCCVKARHRSK